MTKLYRVTLPVSNIETATRFYRALLCTPGERISPGMHYFTCGHAVLACYDPAAEGQPAIPHPHAAPLFVALDEMAIQVHARAGTLDVLDIDPTVRTLPSGERGFMLRDPFGNRLCLVEAGSLVWGLPSTFKLGGQGGRPKAAASNVMLFEKDFLNAVKGGEMARVKELIALDPDLAFISDASGISVLLLAAYKRNPHIGAYLLSFRQELSVWEAAAYGQSGALDEWLSRNPGRINEAAVDGFLPLGLACFFGHLNCAALLIERGADVNAPTHNARRLRPIHSALSHEHTDTALDLLHLLISAGADVNAVQERDITPLHQAADRGDASLVRLLLAAGAKVGARASNGRTAAELAMMKGHEEVLEVLTAPPRFQ